MVAPEHNQSPADDPFISCDWGTTSFRLKYVDAKNSLTTDGISGPEGIKTVHKEWSEYTGSFNRIDFYLSFLKKNIEILERKVQADLSPCRVVISGMASSSVGIKELPYSRLPLNMKIPNLHVEKLPERPQLPQHIYLVSGLRSANDVMRGEETQLIGLDYTYGLENGTYLITGTHSKQVTIQNRRAVHFKTFMTGELFDLISTQSILSQSVSTLENVSESHAFEEGVQQSSKEHILHALFNVRTRDLLHHIKRPANADFLSGLLIGAELKELSTNKQAEILIFGGNRLQKRYARACDVLKLNARCTDANPEIDITALGHRLILQQIIS